MTIFMVWWKYDGFKVLWYTVLLIIIIISYNDPCNRDEGGYSTLQKTFSGEIPECVTKNTLILNVYRGKPDYQAYN